MKITGIILVGGLGASPYLYEHLKSRLSAAKIEILQSGGIKPRTAICRGAVFKGFIDGFATGDMAGEVFHAIGAPISVTSTIARASFGMRYYTAWDGTQNPEDKTWNEDEGRYTADNQMRWYIKKGDNVSKTNPVRHPFYKLHKSDPGRLFSTTLYQCEDVTPPDRCIASVTKLCELSRTHDAPFSTWEDFTNPSGKKMKKLNFEIEMIPSGASLEFAVYVQGRRQGGNTTVSYQ